MVIGGGGGGGGGTRKRKRNENGVVTSDTLFGSVLVYFCIRVSKGQTKRKETDKDSKRTAKNTLILKYTF